MTNYYISHQDQYTYCKPYPKYKSKDYDYSHIENKCSKIFKKKCDCPINTTEEIAGAFVLECGSSLKIFESDEPVEMDMEIRVEDITNEDLCNLKAKVLLQDGNVLEFDLPNPRAPGLFPQNIISFYSKDVLKVTLECESSSGIGCTGDWTFILPIREFKKNYKCKCPVNKVIQRSNIYSLECGSSQKIFESNKPVEMDMTISLQGEFEQDSCDLNVIVELEDGSTLEFHIPNPNVIPDLFRFNNIAFYSKNVRSVILQCLNGVATGCMGIWARNIILRGSTIESL